MIVLRCTNQLGTVADLDVLETVDIKVDMSAIEVGDIGEVFGVSSQAFTLPATKNNQDFLGYLDELNATNNVGFINTIPCQVLNDGIEIFTGKMYVNNVITNSKGDSLYEVVVVNGTVDFSIAIKNLQIQDLDFSDYDHAYNYGNITGSWSNNLFSGKVVYPLVDYGVDPDNALATELAAGGDVGKFDNSSSPIGITDFKPAIKAAVVLEKMFEAVGFNYTSSFIDSADFQNLFILSTQDDKSGVSFTNPVTQSFQALAAAPSPSQTISSITPDNVQFTREQFDNAGNYDGVETFTATEDGNYTFYHLLTFYENHTGGIVTGSQRQLQLEFTVNGGFLPGASTFLNLRNQDPQQLRTKTLGPIGINLEAGDTVEVKLTYDVEGTTNLLYVGQNSRFEGIGPSTLVGGTVQMNNIFAPETKVVDIFKGLIQKFNLIVEPVPGSRNLLSIETFNDWIDQGSTLDWTSKIDRNIKFKIEHPLQTQPKTLKFSDVLDKDPVNQYHVDNFGYTYGEYIYDSSSDLAKGEKKIGTFFSPTPYKGLAGAPTMVLPKLNKKEQNQANSPLKFKPRLLYNLGLYDNAIELKGRDTTAGQDYPGNYFMRDEAGTIHRISQYSHFSHLSAYPAVFETTKDLHFGNLTNPGFWPYHQNQGNGYTLHSAFYDYWSFYVNELYDVDARLLTCNVIIDPSELPTLRLNSKIFIDGNYYRIDKISGASLLDKSSVEVKLLKTAPRKNRYPRRRIIDRYSGDKVYDVISGDPTVNGFVTYSNYDDGTEVKGVNIVNAALLDGYLAYDKGQETVWEPPRNIPLNVTNNTIQGNNTVDESVDKVLISGDYNQVYNSVRNSSVVGNDNNVYSEVNLANVSGRNNTVFENATNVQILGGSLNQIVSASASENLGIFNSYSSSLSNGSFTNIVGGIGNSINGSNLSAIINGTNMTLSGSTNQVTVIGGENVDIINGNYHVVIGKDDEATGGGTLDLDRYRFNTNVLNGTYLDGDLYTNRDGFQISASAGGITYAYSGDGLYKYAYEVNWSGSATGTHTIDLPGIVSQDQYGRTILIKCGSSIASNKAVDITVVGGGTIDGRTSYTLNSPYAWVELRASEFYQVGGEARDTETEWRVINSSAGIGEASYGSFFNNSQQTLGAVGVSQSVQLGQTYESSSVYTTGSKIIFDNPGTYEFQYVAQVANYSNAVQDANFWVKYNGNDYPNSNTRVTLPARKSASEPSFQLMTANFIGTATGSGDYIELYWDGSSTELGLFYTGSGATNGEPATPSVIANVHSLGGGGGGGTAVAGDPFPYTGDAEITGSLSITGSTTFEGDMFSTFLSSSRVYDNANAAATAGVQNGQIWVDSTGVLYLMLNSGSVAAIVTDQLRGYYNANNLTSYPGSGSTWFDLSGNGRDLTLAASPTYISGTPNAIDCTTGTDFIKYAPAGTLTPLTSQGDTYTVMMFMAVKADTGNFRTFIRDINGTSASDFLIVNNGTNTLGTYDTTFRTLGIDVSTDFPSYSTQYNCITMTMNDGGAGNDVNIYLNGSGSALGGNDFPLRFDGPGVFGAQETGNQAGAKVAAILVYDKVLSAAEMEQNYNALAAQMGL